MLDADALARVKRDGRAKLIAGAWRELTGDGRRGAPLLVACSGGADSTGLLLALAACGAVHSVAHVVHDLRSEAEALADRDAARAVASGLGIPFAEARVTVRIGGTSGANLEAGARRARYAALTRMAVERGLGFVATAHHMGDQAETVLMRAVRGSSPGALRGIARTRKLEGLAAGRRIALIRPMLGMPRETGPALCALAGVRWREDETNRDESRLRAWVRWKLLPMLDARAPGVEARLAGLADGAAECSAFLSRAAARTMRRAAIESGSSGAALRRAELRRAPGVVVALVLRQLAGAVGTDRGAGRRGMDGVSRDMTVRASRAVRDGSGETREFDWGRVVVRVLAERVEVRAK
ncbi:MAG: tRNA lysidine(34) synthetase TilS [Phycisphaerae bacterium]|nr:tRNA lysidine(34) synthetase TilS [Phycisphaerae bacterium]